MDIDLVTRGKSTSLTYIFLDPSFKGDYTLVDFATLYCDSEIKTFEQEVVLCQALEDLPCCASDEAGVQTAPLNVVSIAELEEAGATFLRRDYRYTDLSARYVFGRPQDTSGQK